MSEQDALAEAVKAFVVAAQSAFTVSYEKTDIKQASDKLNALMREWDARDKLVRQTVRGLLDLVRRNCKHDGARRGYNERDGSWMNPCPTCGASE